MRSTKILGNRMYARLASRITLILMLILSFALILSVSTATYAAESEGLGGTPYTTDYENQDEVYDAANEFNKLLVAEGIVLLKNDDNALPLSVGSKLNVFGKNSAAIAIGGTGSSTGSGSVEAEKMVSLYNSLTNAGFEINPDLVNFYEDDALSGDGRVAPNMGANLLGLHSGETPIENYPQSLIDTYATYNDAAIFVITRIGGEGYDLPTTMLQQNGELMPTSAEGDHYLELDLDEEALLASLEANPNINDVIIIVNASQQMELGFLNDSVNYSKIKAAIWVGGPGQAGVDAIGKVLSGEVNPSGHLVDTYAADFTTDPTWYNFGTSGDNGKYGTVTDEVFTAGNKVFVDYEEGIYLGYRYWETRGFEENDSWAWYDQHVVYPFGYGLSYTTFDWTFVSSDIPAALTVDSEVSVTVEVENTGSVAGKEVVQLYYTAPYFDGGIEKSYVKLADFAKTSLLAPGATEQVTLTVSLKDMSSYDYDDANGNGFMGFELEAGTYTLRVLQNANVRNTNGVADIDFIVPVAPGNTATVGATGIQFPNDEVTGHPIENLFDDISQKAINGTLADPDTQAVKDSGGVMNVMTRESALGGLAGTIPTDYPSDADRTVSQTFLDTITTPGNAAARALADEGQPWYRETFPTQAEDDQGEVSTLLREMIGLPYDDPLWEVFMNQMTYKEMAELIGHGSFHTIAIPRLGKPWSLEVDGPVGLVPRQTTNDLGPSSSWEQNERACVYATEPVVAATWNKELVYDYGQMTGEESLWGNTAYAYSGIYAPGLNIHRSPFSGRNGEYYSEDGVLSGIMGAEFSAGAESKGLYVMMKHYALNDQETNRGGILTWADEQTMREIYLLPFEKSIKDGHARGAMSAFNSIGTKWAGASYALNIDLTREEWGFEGMIITDWTSYSSSTHNWMIRTGNDLVLGGSGEGTLAYEGDDLTPTHAWALRRAAKAIMFTVANSNAMVPRLSYNTGSIEVPYFFGNQAYTLDISGAATNYELETPPTITYTAINLPEQLTLDPTTGIITGTLPPYSAPSYWGAGTPSEYTFTITASVDSGVTINSEVSKEFTISQASLEEQKVVNSGYVGVEYFSDVLRYEPTLPADVTYQLDPGLKYGSYVIRPASTLPDGLVLNSDGTITGVPTTEVANHSFTVNISAPGVISESITRTITILPEPSPDPVLIFENDLLTNGQIGEAYSETFMATGSDSITFTSGNLPAGLALNSSGALTGTPTEAGVFMFAVTASADGFDPVVATFALEVIPEAVVVPDVIVFEDDLLTAGQVGETYSATFSASGATGITFASEDLPAGISLSAAGELTGTPTEAGMYFFTVTASAAGSEDVEASFALNVAPEATGCGSAINIPTVIMGMLSLVLVGVIILKKRH